MLGTQTDYCGAVKPSSIEQSVYEADLFATRFTEIPSNMQMRCDYDSKTDGQPKYGGYAPRDLAEGTDGWMIQYYEYDTDRQCTKRTISYGNWTNSASETYA